MLSTNCWIYPLNDDGEGPAATNEAPRPCAVIDPGAEVLRIITYLKELNLYPSHILLTHGHFDHLAALPDLAAAYEGVLIAIHRDDASSLGPGAYPVHAASFTLAAGDTWYVDNLWKPMPSPGLLLSGGERFGSLETIHLPGHSPGSVGFLDRAAGVLFSGDTLFRDGIGRVDLNGGDAGRLAESLEKLFALDGNIRVCPGHGEETTIAREAALGSRFV